MKNWWTVTLIVDYFDPENGPVIDNWDHPFNEVTAEGAVHAAERYYEEMPDVQIGSVRPATAQEVLDFLNFCYGPHDEDDDLPF